MHACSRVIVRGVLRSGSLDGTTALMTQLLVNTPCSAAMHGGCLVVIRLSVT